LHGNMSASVLGSVLGRVGRIVLHNPSKKNAMTLGMYQAVPAAVQTVMAQGPGALRVTVLSGHGSDAFGAGSDISEFPRVRASAAQAAAYSEHESAASNALLSIPHPLVAKVRVHCYE
jgi:enoyl-CoA hydratase/carnithine racemase